MLNDIFHHNRQKKSIPTTKGTSNTKIPPSFCFHTCFTILSCSGTQVVKAGVCPGCHWGRGWAHLDRSDVHHSTTLRQKKHITQHTCAYSYRQFRAIIQPQSNSLALEDTEKSHAGIKRTWKLDTERSLVLISPARFILRHRAA